MRRRLVSVCSILGLPLSVDAAGDPTATVTAALTEFLAQPNYSWGASTSGGLPEGQAATFTEAIEGQHETGGYTKAWFLTGPHIPKEEWPSVQPWPGITDDDAFLSSRWVFETPEGWVHLKKLPVEIPVAVTEAVEDAQRSATNPVSRPSTNPIPFPLPFPLPGQKPTPKATPPPRSVLSGGTGIAMGSPLFGFSRPDREAADIVEDLESAVETAPGEFAVVLTPEGIAKIANPKGPSILKHVLPRIENCRVTIKVLLRRGDLTGYQVTKRGTIVFLNQRFPLNYTLFRNITDVGTTVIDVPEEVAAMLGR